MSNAEIRFEASLTAQLRPRCQHCAAPNPLGLSRCAACGQPSPASEFRDVPAAVCVDLPPLARFCFVIANCIRSVVRAL